MSDITIRMERFISVNLSEEAERVCSLNGGAHAANGMYYPMGSSIVLFGLSSRQGLPSESEALRGGRKMRGEGAYLLNPALFACPNCAISPVGVSGPFGTGQ